MDAATHARILAAHSETRKLCCKILEDIGGDVDKFMRFLDNVREQEREEGQKEGIAARRNMINNITM